MAITNQERVAKSMELLRAGLAPFVEREVHSAVKGGTVRMDAVRRFAEDPKLGNRPIAQWDAAGLLKLMWETWNDVFGRTLGRAERSLVSECGMCATNGRIRSLSPATTPTTRSTRPDAC